MIFVVGFIYTPTEMSQKYKEKLNLHHLKDFDFVGFFTGHFSIIDQAHELAYELSSRYHIGLFTNLHPGSYELIIKKGYVPKIKYKAVVCSFEYGVVKPEPAIYQIAQEKANEAPEQILFIDDLEINIKVAKDLGWQGEVFDEANPKQSIAKIKRKLRNSA